MPPRGKKKSKGSRKRSATASRKKSAAKKTRRVLRAGSRKAGTRKTSARKASARKATRPRKASGRKSAAKRSVKRAAKPSTSGRKSSTATRRIPTNPAVIEPDMMDGGLGESVSDNDPLSLGDDELIDEAELDLGGDDEDAPDGDDDLDGM